MLTRIFVAATLALSLAAPALADNTADSVKPEKKKDHAEAYAKLDTNGDGKLSYDELRAKFPNYPESKFKERDKNGDGFLTRDEQTSGKDKPARPEGEAKGGKPAPGELFKRADKDSDGVVTLDEIHAIAPNFPQDKFIKLDKNGDGKLEADEVARAREAGAPGHALAKADTDHDGKVTFAEVSAAAPNFPKERFEQLDKNKDGALTPDELRDGAPGGQGEMFKRADTNGDGKLTFEELSSVAPNMDKERFDKIDKNRDGYLTPDEAPGAGGNQQPIAMLARKADADKNGSVTFDEMHAVAPNLTKERFDALDRNKDGVLTEADRGESPKNEKLEKGDKSSVSDGAAKLMETDANKDGKVTFEEVTAAKPGFPKEAFDRADRNKDGVLTQEDAAAK